MTPARLLRIEVAFTPALLVEPKGKVCLVVDTLRLTSSAVTMFARGLAEALVAGTIDEARRLAREHNGYLLCESSTASRQMALTTATRPVSSTASTC